MNASDNNRAIRAADLLLTSSAIVLSFITLIGGRVVPLFFATTYRIETTTELTNFLPNISKTAFQNSWCFAIVLICISIVGIIQLHRMSAQIAKFVILSLCLEALVFWFAMFCFFYNEFFGPIDIHHEPTFDMEAFAGFCWGIFPISLIAILVPIPFALAIKKQIPIRPS